MPPRPGTPPAYQLPSKLARSCAADFPSGSARSRSTRCCIVRGRPAPTPRSSAAPSRPQLWSTCGRCGWPGCPPTRRSGSWSPATPRPPTSSRPSPSCGAARVGLGSPGRAAVRRHLREAAWAVAVHAVSSWSMLTRRDPWNNILRATLACFAAGGGGGAALTVAPLDAALGQPAPLAPRVARNVHTALLVEESHAAWVIDPAERVLVRRGPHRAARGQGLGLVPGDRAVGRTAGGAGGRGHRRPAGGQPRGAAGRTGPATRGHHRRQRVPADRGDPAQQARRRPPGRRPGRAAPHPLVAVARGTPRPRGRPRRGHRIAADDHARAARRLASD